MDTLKGENNKLPLTKTTPYLEEILVTDEQTNELYFRLTSAVVLRRKMQTLYVPVEFRNNLKNDAPVNSRAYVGAIAHNEMERTKEKHRIKSSELTTLPIFKFN